MFVRKPLLCLDTNASIDIGVVENLRRGAESLEEQIRKIDDVWTNLFYDKALMEDVAGRLQDRHDQLTGTERFLHLAQCRSFMRLPEFARIEHRRVRPDATLMPGVPVEVLTSEVHEISLELFSKTNLGLQDSLVLASSVGMRADALVSNDDDFKRAFNESIGSIASEITGKPLLLVDHRLPSSRPHEKQPTLHGMLLESLHRHYGEHPSRGRPLWIDRRGGTGDWYLAYQHPLPPIESQLACIVPGMHSVSILDENSWTVCKVESIHYDKEGFPEGITPESIGRIERYHASQRDHRPEIGKYFRRPANDKWGYVRISMALKEFPPSWSSWEHPGEGKRASTKRRAPKGALGFVETDCGI